MDWGTVINLAGMAAAPYTFGGSAIAAGAVTAKMKANAAKKKAALQAGGPGQGGTGGGTSVDPYGLGTIGAGLSGAAQGAEDERAAGDDYRLRRDQLGVGALSANERALNERGQLDLAQHAQSLKSGESAFQNALRASVIQNFAPANRPKGVANISFINGGPSAGAKAAASAMEHEAMQRLLNGEQFATQPAFQPYDLHAGLDPQKASTLEKVMGIAGLASSGLGAYLKYRQGQNDDDGGLSGFSLTE